MKDEFIKFKKKIYIEHFLKSIIFGLSLSAILTALLIIILKQGAIELFFVFYILIYIFLSACFICGFYFLFKPKDLAIAKRLDKSFNLKEKAQTMLEYPSSDNEILKMQKEDTNNSLKDVSVKELKINIAFGYFILMIIGLILMVLAIFVPSKEGGGNITSSSSNSSSSSSTSVDFSSGVSTQFGSGGESSESGDGSNSGNSLESGVSSSMGSDSEDAPPSADTNSTNSSVVSGDGETIYPGDDTIFTDEGFKEYGDKIDDYYSHIVDMGLNEDIPDELSDILDEYFSNLYGGNKNDK